MEAPELGNGTTIVFGTSGFTGEIVKASVSGKERAEIDTSHLGTENGGANEYGGGTWKPGKLSQAGELELEIHSDLDVRPLLMEDPEIVTITYPLGDGETTPTIDSGEAFAKAEDGPDIEVDGKLVTVVKLRKSGKWTITPAT